MINHPIKIYEENENFVVVEKPAKLIVHPWKECADKESLLKILKLQTGRWIYPVHRLDRPVSGVMVFAYNKDSARELAECLSRDDTIKIYLALVKGQLEKPVTVSYSLWNQGKTKKQESKTAFWPLATTDYATLLKARIFTGRYHQIRRHCSAMAHQVIGDSKYGKGKYNRYYRENFALDRLFLHCGGLEMTFPDGQKRRYHSPLPPELEHCLQKQNIPIPGEMALFQHLEQLPCTVNKADIVKAIDKNLAPN